MRLGGPVAWAYEPDEAPKRKHHWGHEYAGFLEIGANEVGKCPSGMTVLDASVLLNDAVAFFPSRWSRSYPQRLYAVKDGVVYRATPTNPGTSYHGFPEHPARFPGGGNAAEVKRELLERAKLQGCEKEVRQWMNW